MYLVIHDSKDYNANSAEKLHVPFSAAEHAGAKIHILSNNSHIARAALLNAKLRQRGR